MTQEIKYYIYPYKQSSESARLLAQVLSGKVLLREGSRFIPRPWKKVVNWGASDCPWEGLNNRNRIRDFSNKLTAFQIWSEQIELAVGPNPRVIPRIPRWTISRDEAVDWLVNGMTVVSRMVLNGHSGQGIVISKNGDASFPDAPLYVEYIPKDAEYRVHIFNGEIIDVQRKVRDPDREVLDWKVRSHRNGFIYIRRNSDGESYRDACPGDVLEQSKRALACSGLVFGAVDVLWNRNRNQAFVVEINSAPGLSGSTVDIYASAIKRFYGEQDV